MYDKTKPLFGEKKLKPIATFVSVEIKTLFAERAKRYGLSESEFLRNLVITELKPSLQAGVSKNV
jgi:hypothetical protein